MAHDVEVLAAIESRCGRGAASMALSAVSVGNAAYS
jgi:hypothetical protein